MKQRRPSITSLVAFFLIVPTVYILSYAPVVRVGGRTLPPPGFVPPGIEMRPMAHGRLYPPYKPVDWLIDNTPVRKPLFAWAGLWGVRAEFDVGWKYRYRDRINESLTEP